MNLLSFYCWKSNSESEHELMPNSISIFQNVVLYLVFIDKSLSSWISLELALYSRTKNSSIIYLYEFDLFRVMPAL